MNFIDITTVGTKSIYDQPILEVPLDEINATVDLHTGQASIAITDISDGDGIYTMDVSHIYNGGVTTDIVYGSIHTYMGIGFKLNIQQYLVKTWNSSIPYIYLDAAGRQHGIAVNNGVYYDTSGLGLIMTEEGSRRILTDTIGNQLIFDAYGYLIKSKGLFGNEIDYIYDGDKLVKMQHAKDKLRAYSFVYAMDIYGNVTLRKIRCDLTRREIDFQYVQNNKLNSITKINGNQSELISTFTYHYDNKVNSVGLRNTPRKLQFDYSDSKIVAVKESANSSIKWEKVISYADLYNYNQTTVFSNDGITLVYSFKPDGELYSIVEHNQTQIYTPVYPQANSSGVKVFKLANDDKSEVFNSYKVFRASQNNAKTDIKYYFDNLINSAETIKNDINASGLQTITFSGWVWIEQGECDANLVVEFKDTAIKAKIDKSLKGWQYVSTTFERSNFNDFKAVYLEVQANDYYLINVSDLRFSAPNQIETLLKDSQGNKYWIGDISTAAVTYDNNNINYTVSLSIGTNKLTGSDLETTLMKKFLNSNNFNFVYDHGRKLIAKAKKVVLKTKQGASIELKEGVVTHEYAIKSGITIHNQISNTYAYSSKFGTNCITTSKKLITDGNEEVSEEYRDFRGLLLGSKNSYGIEYYYQYDSYGNLIHKQIVESVNGSDNPQDRETINISTKYSSNGENVDYEEDQYGIKNLQYSYNKPEMALESITDALGNKEKYSYDNLGYLTSVSSLATRDSNTFAYNSNNGRVAQVSHNSFGYQFLYNDFDDLTHFSVGNKNILQVVRDYTNNKSTIDYANGFSVTAENDKYGRTINIKEGNTIKIKNLYCDERGDTYAEGSRATSAAKLRAVEDNYAGLNYTYNYDDNDNLKGYVCRKSGSDFIKIENDKSNDDSFDNKSTYTFDRNTIKNYTKSENGRTKFLKLSLSSPLLNDANCMFEYFYDGFGNIKKAETPWDTKEIIKNYNEGSKLEQLRTTISSKATNNHVTHILYSNTDKRTDIASSVYSITKPNGNKSIVNVYTYDSLNRLTSDRKNINGSTLDYFKTYTYNAGGNRISRKTETPQNNKTTQYYYENSLWKDMLTRMVENNVTYYFDYDEVGNPVRYKTARPSSEINMTWTRGRLLSNYNNVSFTYYGNGRRLTKTANGITKTYYYDEDRLLGESWSNGLHITYDYDIMGLSLMRVRKDGYGTEYAFRYNIDAQGNVIELTDFTNYLRYSYDAFGNITIDDDFTLSFGAYSIPLSQVNPFTYRSYYWDHETGFYYLMARYYDPDTGRFINADDISYLTPLEINGLNLYNYCTNDPVNYKDNNGYFKIAAFEDRESYGHEFAGLNLGFFWIGSSVYNTKTTGGNGFFYAYKSQNYNIGNFFDFQSTSVGVGLNFFNNVSFEIGVKFLGSESSISIGKWTFSANFNIFGGISMSISKTDPTETGTITTTLEIGFNTITLALIVVSALTGAPVSVPSEARLGVKIKNFFRSLFGI